MQMLATATTEPKTSKQNKTIDSSEIRLILILTKRKFLKYCIIINVKRVINQFNEIYCVVEYKKN